MGDRITMRKNLSTPFLFALAAVLTLAGCSSSDQMTDPGSGQAATAVEVSAARAAAGAPSADLGGDLAANIAIQSGIGLGSCPATFDLGNGISGTCAESPEGTFNFAFSGTTVVKGQSATVSGTMVAVAGASNVTIDLDATTSSATGNATISANGTVTPGPGGLSAVSLTVEVTVSKTGQAAVSGTFVVTPTGMSISANNGGVLVGVAMNRETMTGTASIGGVVVAAIAIQNGCAIVDFVDPTVEDRTICPD